MNKEETQVLISFFTSIRNAIDNLLTQLAPIKSIEELKSKIPDELKDVLIYEENQHYFIVRPRQYLGAENFAKILDTIRELGGEYVSKGKDSHFRVYKGA